MKSGFSFFVVVLVILSAIPLMMIPDSDGQDVDYRDPPAADVVFKINLSMKSDDPTYTVRFDSDYSEAAGDMAKAVYAGNMESSHYDSVTESHCLPSWIQYDYDAPSLPGNQVGRHYYLDVKISPALQQVTEDTHGEYWIFFDHVRTNLLSSDDETKYLIQISLDVKWNGSVIVKDTVYHTYALHFDSVGGSVSQTYYRQFLEAEDTGICYFDTTSVIPSKVGYKFLGWSTVNGDSQPLDVSDDFPFVRSAADSVNSSDPLNVTYSKTLYAVWAPAGFPNSWDELLSLLLDPVFLIVFTLIIIVLALFIRHRRIGGYY